MSNLKKIMSLFVVSMLMITPSFAQNYIAFYKNESRHWIVEGVPKRDQLNPICRATTSWNDGSEFNFIIDLVDGELYILFINNSWDIGDPVNKFYNFRMNVHSGNNIRGFNGEYELLSKNTIRVRNIDKKFVDYFADADEFRFIMPGSINNAKINLTGSGHATAQLSQCVKSFK